MLIADDKKEKFLKNNKKQNIKDEKNFIGKSLNNKSIKDKLLGRIFQDGLFASELILFLKEIKFS